MKKVVLFIDNTAHHLFGQLHNITAIQDAGYSVKLLVPDDGIYFSKLSSLGYECISSIDSWKGQNPLAEFKLILQLRSVLKEIKPQIVCTFTIKPNLYTAIINKNNQFSQIANITGLGYAFMKSKLKTYLFTKLYKFALFGVRNIFFQNPDDYAYLKNLGILSQFSHIDVLPGSGVDLSKFPYTPMVIHERNAFTFMYSGRIIADKGIYELITAFRRLKELYNNARLIIIGNFFPDNPTSITEAEFYKWVKDGLVEYLGMVDNVYDIIVTSDCVILPSYREGMPRSILEASSVGRPVITVNSIGCKDAVEDGITGFIAKVKDADDLFDKMEQIINLPYNKLLEIGLSGRKKMENDFDQKIVIDKYLNAVNNIDYILK